MIPDKGRLLKCGICNETWFFNKDIQDDSEIRENNTLNNNLEKKTNFDIPKNRDIKIKKSTLKHSENKGTELIRYKSKSNFKISRLLNYIIVSIISFIGIIIILDTFKNPLSIIIPNLELILYNLFETLNDLILFAKDLK